MLYGVWLGIIHHNTFSFLPTPESKVFTVMKILHPRTFRSLLVGAKSGNCIYCVRRVELGVARRCKSALWPEAGISVEKGGRLQAGVWETQLLFRRLRHKGGFFKNWKVTWLDRRIQERVNMITCQETGGKAKDHGRQRWRACGQGLEGALNSSSTISSLCGLGGRALSFLSTAVFCIYKMRIIILFNLPGVC